MPRIQHGGHDGETLRYDLILGYDPANASNSKSNSESKSSSKRRTSDQTKSSSSASSKGPGSHKSFAQKGRYHKPRPNLKTRDGPRNDSPWTPESSTSSIPLEEQITNDTFSNVSAELHNISDSWSQRIIDYQTAERASGRNVRDVRGIGNPKSAGKERAMPAFKISVMGFREAGKSTFIASALDLDTIDDGGSSSHERKYEVDDEQVSIHISEHSVDFDPTAPADKYIERAAAGWVPIPFQIDGAIVLYDITSKRSLAAIPILLRTYKEAGIPLLLVGTKSDVDTTHQQLKHHAVQHKARLIIDGLIVFQSSIVSPETAKRCIDILIRDLAHRRKEEDIREQARREEERRIEVIARKKEAQRQAQERTQKVRQEEKKLPPLPPLAISKHKHRPSVFYDDNSSESDNNSESGFEEAAASDPEMARQRQSRRASSPTVPPAMSPVGAMPIASPFMGEDDQESPGLKVPTGGYYRDEERTGFRPDKPILFDAKLNEKMDTASLVSLQTRDRPGIEGCNLNDLVDRLLQSITPEQDSRFAYRFLALYRLFASPLQLLNNIIKHCFAPYGEAAADSLGAIDGHVFQILYHWVNQYPGDFALESTNSRLLEFLDALDREDDPFPAASRIRDAVNNVLHTDDMYWGVLSADDTFTHSNSASPKIPPGTPISAATSTSSLASTSSHSYFGSESDLDVIFQTSRLSPTLTAMGPYDIRYGGKPSHNASQVSQRAQRLASGLVPDPRQTFGKPQWRLFMQQSEEALAREMTRIDWILFSAATPRDLLRHATMTEAEREQYPALKSVRRMVQHFNHVAEWTANLILVRDKPKHRALVYEKLIRVARELRKMNNYSSLGAIVAGMNDFPITRLSITHSFVPPAVLLDWRRLDVLMSVQQGHRTYRTAWEHTSTARIPFLPVHVRDLYLAEKGNKTYISPEDTNTDSSDPLINWTKFDMLGGILQEFHSALSTPYPPLQANEVVRVLLLRVRLKNSDDLYDRSKEVEPADAAAVNKQEIKNNFRKMWLV